MQTTKTSESASVEIKVEVPTAVASAVAPVTTTKVDNQNVKNKDECTDFSKTESGNLPNDDTGVPTEITKLMNLLREQRRVKFVLYNEKERSLSISSTTCEGQNPDCATCGGGGGIPPCWVSSSILNNQQWNKVVGLINSVTLLHFRLRSEDKAWFTKVGIKLDDRHYPYM